MSSPVSVTSPSAFFPRSPRTPDSVELAPGAKASCNDGCDGDAQGANKGGRCAPLEFTDGQHMCFFCFKMMPRGA